MLCLTVCFDFSTLGSTLIHPLPPSSVQILRHPAPPDIPSDGKLRPLQAGFKLNVNVLNLVILLCLLAALVAVPISSTSVLNTETLLG